MHGDYLSPEQERVFDNLLRYPQLRLFPDDAVPRRESSVERARRRLGLLDGAER